VNVPLRNQTFEEGLTGNKKLDKYSFSKIFTLNDSVEKKLNFNAYPHLVIVKNDTVYYNGILSTEKGLLPNRNNLENLINDFLKN